jgi:hypothetical protein
VPDPAWTALATLAAVALGGYVTRASNTTAWRRTQRADAFSEVIRTGEALLHRLEHAQVSDPYSAPLQPDDLLNLTRELRTAIALAELYGGRGVRDATARVYTELWSLVDEQPHAWEVGEVSARIHELHNAMRHDLHGRLRWWGRGGAPR